MLSVHQHWDPLKVAAVGRCYPPEYFNYIQNLKTRDVFHRIAEETEEDFQKLTSLLQKFDVKVKTIELDFSSIAKGFAIDKVYDFLDEQQNIKSFFIEIGGEIRSTSLKSNDQPGKAGIVNPSDQDKIIYTFLSSSFDSFALASSGDYINSRILD